jgi:hypothetical protein
MLLQVTDKCFKEWERDVFGFGYGTGEAHILPALQTFLRHVDGGHTYTAQTIERVLGGPVTWLLINVLCHADILDYGTSPRCGWVTPQGERLRAYVVSKTVDQLYAIVTQAPDPTQPLCSRTFCNCPDGTDTAGCRHNPLFSDTVSAPVES